MVEFYLLTFSRFPLRKKEHISYLGKNRTRDFRTSRFACYLLDHSGDERETVVLPVVLYLRPRMRELPPPGKGLIICPIDIRL